MRRSAFFRRRGLRLLFLPLVVAFKATVVDDVVGCLHTRGFGERNFFKTHFARHFLRFDNFLLFHHVKASNQHESVLIHSSGIVAQRGGGGGGLPGGGGGGVKFAGGAEILGPVLVFTG